MNASKGIKRKIAIVIVTLLAHSLVISSAADAGIISQLLRLVLRKPMIVNRVEKELISGGKAVWLKGRKILQRNSIIRKSAKNCNRMKMGLAPIGPDNLPIQLHHLRQKNHGWLVELTTKEHTGNTRALHGYTGKSEIERRAFNAWRSQYWRQRAGDLCR